MNAQSRFFVIAEVEITLLNGFETRALHAQKSFLTEKDAKQHIEMRKKQEEGWGETYKAFIMEIHEEISSAGEILKGVYCIPRSHEVKGTVWENVLLDTKNN